MVRLRPAGADTRGWSDVSALSAPRERGFRVPTASYVLGGLSLAALGSFTYFGLSGRGMERALSDECSPRCSDARVDSVRTQYVIADVSLGIAVVSLGIATVLALTHNLER